MGFFFSKEERCAQIEIKKTGRIGILSVIIELFFSYLRELIVISATGFNQFSYITQMSCIFFIFFLFICFVLFYLKNVFSKQDKFQIDWSLI